MVEGTGRIAEGQAQAVDEQAQPLREDTAGTAPEQQGAGQRQQQSGAVTPGADGLAKVKEVHAVPSAGAPSGRFQRFYRPVTSPVRR